MAAATSTTVAMRGRSCLSLPLFVLHQTEFSRSLATACNLNEVRMCAALYMKLSTCTSATSFSPCYHLVSATFVTAFFPIAILSPVFMDKSKKQVTCYCKKKCGGPGGSGKSWSYATVMKHKKEDWSSTELSTSSNFDNFLKFSSHSNQNTGPSASILPGTSQHLVQHSSSVR